MASKADVYYAPYSQRMRGASPAEVEAIAHEYINHMITSFSSEGERRNGLSLLSFLRVCQKNWAKLCYHDNVIQVDEDGSEYMLSEENFPELFYARIIELEGSTEMLSDLKHKMKAIYQQLGWSVPS